MPRTQLNVAPAIPLLLPTEMTQARCLGVTVEAAAAREDTEETLVATDIGSDWPRKVLRWAGHGDAVTVSAHEALQAVLSLVDALAYAHDSGDFSPFESTLVDIHYQYGPLLNVDPAEGVGYPNLVNALMPIYLAAIALNTDTPLRDNFPAPLIVSEELLHALADLAVEGPYPDEFTESKLVSALLANMRLLEVMPAQFDSRDAGVVWVREAGLRGLLAMVKACTYLDIGFDANGMMAAIAKPVDLYGLAALTLLQRHEKVGMHPCACGCGELVPRDRRFVSKTHSRRTNTKQNLLAMYRGRIRSGRYTKDQYNQIRQYINSLSKKELEGRALIERQVGLLLAGEILGRPSGKRPQ